jgi:uncharacterized protein
MAQNHNVDESYLSPRLEARSLPAKGEYGVFAREPVKAGELIAMWGGMVIPGEELYKLPEHQQSLSVQVEEDLYLVTTRPSPADRVNHCCNPNAGLRGQTVVVAMRDIAPGEEVCIDYAMCDSTPYDEFECACGAVNCRGRITGDDWRNPLLWQRYEGFFSPYLQRRIEQLKPELEVVQQSGYVVADVFDNSHV